MAHAGGAAQGQDGGDVHVVERFDQLLGRLALLSWRHGVGQDGLVEVILQTTTPLKWRKVLVRRVLSQRWESGVFFVFSYF